MNKMAGERHIPQKPILEIFCALQGVLGEENQRVFAKTGRSLGVHWAAAQPRAANAEDLMGRIAAYLKDDLQAGESVACAREGKDYVLKIRGCYICHGQMVREKHGILPACPLSVFPVGAMRTNLEINNVRLVEIRKPGPNGDCDMIYEIKN